VSVYVWRLGCVTSTCEHGPKIVINSDDTGFWFKYLPDGTTTFKNECITEGNKVLETTHITSLING